MKVFQLNECDWYMAPTLEDAIAQSMADSGLPRDEAVEDPHELSIEEMQRLTFIDDDENKRTFQAEMDRRLAAGPKTEFFASTNF